MRLAEVYETEIVWIRELLRRVNRLTARPSRFILVWLPVDQWCASPTHGGRDPELPAVLCMVVARLLTGREQDGAGEYWR